MLWRGGLGILEAVNRRATSWLLATLMALCAAQALPVARTARTPESSQIVWVARARAERRLPVQRHAASTGRRVVARLQPDCVPLCDRLVSHSLYQRPPPFSRG